MKQQPRCGVLAALELLSPLTSALIASFALTDAPMLELDLVGGEDARGWVKRFADARRLGAYARVVRKGVVRAGDPITVVSVPDVAPTIAGAFRPE